MRERLDKVLEWLKELKDKIGRRNLIIIFVSILIVAIGSIVLVKIASIPTYEVLYTGLSQDEQTEILGKLQELGIETKSNDNGEIQVLEGQADNAQAQLAMQGYPKSGLSYDIFTENVNLTSTDFEKETYKIYELQNRLAATIRCFNGVKDATVTISPAEESDYVLKSEDDDSPATASVTVIMAEKDASPTADQVTGIQKLVSSSVPKMKPENVVVIDGNGNTVSEDLDSGLADATSLSALKIQLEQTAEKSIKQKVENLLMPVYGDDKVRVSVNCTVDIDKKVSEALTYYPSEDGDNSGVTNKMTLDWEAIGEVESPGGVVGTETNSEVPTYPYITEGDDGNYYTDKRTYEFLVSQLTEQIEKNAGEVSDTNVAVVIDSGELTAKDINDLKELVGTTAGIPADTRGEKVSVMDTKFFTPENTETTQTVLQQIKDLGPLVYVLIGIVIAFVLGIVVAMSMKKKKKKMQQAQTVLLEPEEGAEEFDWDTETISLDEMEATKEQVLREQIREFASQNPEIAASLIKNWLNDNEGGA